MNKVKTLDDLRKMRETLRSTLDIREKSNHPEQMVQIRISMATCGIAAGAKEIMNYFIEALDREKVDALVTQTGCMGYCYAEPTVEVTLPGKEPLVFGHVKKAKVDEIIDRDFIQAHRNRDTVFLTGGKFPVVQGSQPLNSRMEPMILLRLRLKSVETGQTHLRA